MGRALLLQLLVAGLACSEAAPEFFLRAGLGFSPLSGGEDLSDQGTSRACMTLTAPTAPRSPQSRMGGSMGDSWVRTQWRAWARALLGLRARGGLLSCGKESRKTSELRSPLPSPSAWWTPSYLKPKLPEQCLQCWVPEGHGWEELLHPLPAPPPAATNESIFSACEGPAQILPCTTASPLLSRP